MYKNYVYNFHIKYKNILPINDIKLNSLINITPHFKYFIFSSLIIIIYLLTIVCTQPYQINKVSFHYSPPHSSQNIRPSLPLDLNPYSKNPPCTQFKSQKKITSSSILKISKQQITAAILMLSSIFKR
jgi:hypothetical protein